MNVITAFKISTGTTITMNIPSADLAVSRAASFRNHPNYRDVVLTTDTPAAPVAAPAAPAAPQTGRVGKGNMVHEIVNGSSSKCGSSYRKGFGANRPVYVTGEAVTCRHCSR